MKRAIRIMRAAMLGKVLGVVSPSLGRRVRISDIWRTPWYYG
jgi:hypothetical protein